MKYRVEILPAALADAEEAYLWRQDRSPEHADDWYEGLVAAILSLEEFPMRCAVALESEDLDIEVRQLMYGRRGGVHRILFRIVAPDLVRVLRVRHGAQDRLHPVDLAED